MLTFEETERFGEGQGLDVEGILARVRVKIVVCGDPGVKRVPDGERKGRWRGLET